MTKVRGWATGGTPSRSTSALAAASLAGEPVVLEPQVDEAGAGDLGRLAEVGDVELRDESGRRSRAAACRAACPAASRSWPGSRRTWRPGSAGPCRRARLRSAASHAERLQGGGKAVAKESEDVHAMVQPRGER